MKPIEFHPEAQTELEGAMAWYESHLIGLGLDLHAAVQKTLNRIHKFPRSGSPYRNTEYRFALVKRFPFVVYYLEESERVCILAVAHGRRRPGYWRRRARS